MKKDKFEFTKVTNDQEVYSLRDVAFALELLAEGDVTWHSSTDENWNLVLQHAADILKLYGQHKDQTDD